MFTGLIESTGLVVENKSTMVANRLIVSSTFDDMQVGESIAVNGVCLTLLPGESNGLAHFDVSPETLNVTTLAALRAGDRVNLERAMSATTRFGGHYVSGHVDTVAQVLSVTAIDQYLQLQLGGFDKQAMLYLIPKGSITVDGVSLTINAVEHEAIHLMLVPHTLAHTTLNLLQAGAYVNIEFDYLTRIVAHQLRAVGKLSCEVQS